LLIPLALLAALGGCLGFQAQRVGISVASEEGDRGEVSTRWTVASARQRAGLADLFDNFRYQLAPALSNALITDLCFRFRACCSGVRP